MYDPWILAAYFAGVTLVVAAAAGRCREHAEAARLNAAIAAVRAERAALSVRAANRAAAESALQAALAADSADAAALPVAAEIDEDAAGAAIAPQPDSRPA